MVFDNYTWSADRGTEFVKYGNKLIPSRIPISAFLSGPLGGQAPPDFSHSQLISRAYFDEVTPHSVTQGNFLVEPDSPRSAKGEKQSTILRISSRELGLGTWMASLCSVLG